MVLDFACVSLGLELLFSSVGEFESGCRQGLQAAFYPKCDQPLKVALL